mgnify:FL=1
MKKTMLIGASLFMMAGFLPAKGLSTTNAVECFASTCGVVECYEFPRELNNNERLVVYDSHEASTCP